MAATAGSMTTTTEARPVEGRYRYELEGDADVYVLWLDTPWGPKRVGYIYNHPDVVWIVNRLNGS